MPVPARPCSRLCSEVEVESNIVIEQTGSNGTAVIGENDTAVFEIPEESNTVEQTASNGTTAVIDTAVLEAPEKSLQKAKRRRIQLTDTLSKYYQPKSDKRSSL